MNWVRKKSFLLTARFVGTLVVLEIPGPNIGESSTLKSGDVQNIVDRKKLVAKKLIDFGHRHCVGHGRQQPGFGSLLNKPADAAVGKCLIEKMDRIQ